MCEGPEDRLGHGARLTSTDVGVHGRGGGYIFEQGFQAKLYTSLRALNRATIKGGGWLLYDSVSKNHWTVRPEVEKAES